MVAIDESSFNIELRIRGNPLFGLKNRFHRLYTKVCGFFRLMGQPLKNSLYRTGEPIVQIVPITEKRYSASVSIVDLVTPVYICKFWTNHSGAPLTTNFFHAYCPCKTEKKPLPAVNLGKIITMVGLGVRWLLAMNYLQRMCHETE